MGLLGEPWAPSGGPKTFTADDGRKLTIAVHERGLLVSDEGGATQVAHVEATADPNVILVAGVPFRRVPA